MIDLAQYAALIERNRERYSASETDYGRQADRQKNTAEADADLGTPDLL